MEGLPHLEARKEKGQKEIESKLSGFTQREFVYPDTDFYHFLNGDKEIIKVKKEYIRVFVNYLTPEQLAKIFTLDKGPRRPRGPRGGQGGPRPQQPQQ